MVTGNAPFLLIRAGTPIQTPPIPWTSLFTYDETVRIRFSSPRTVFTSDAIASPGPNTVDPLFLMICSPLDFTDWMNSCTGRWANAGRLEILIPPIVVADQSGTMLSP